MDALPEELLQHIVSFLDVDPPSITSSAQEPHLEGIFTAFHPLKDLILVSRRFRRLVDPVLYQYLRVHVDQILANEAPVIPNPLDLVDGQSKPYQLREWTKPATGARFLARLSRAEKDTVQLRKDDGTEDSLPVQQLSSADQHYIDLLYDHIMTDDSSWSRAQTTVTDSETPPRPDFVSFLARKRRMHRTSARSLVVYYTPSAGPGSGKESKERPSWQRNRVWDVLRVHVNPQRLVIMASPAIIAGLTSCYSDTTDEWAFHIPYQRIELKQDTDNTLLETAIQQREKNYVDAARFTSSSVLFMRYWNSFEYDEGSSLNAYGTYHYFEKVGHAYTSTFDSEIHVLQRPPSIMNRSSLKILGLGSWLRRFTYTAVFPHFVHFSGVLDTLTEFRALTYLTLQLAPEMSSTLLDDNERIGRGNMRLQDCWSELEQCYEGVAQRVLDVGHSPLMLLERFEPMDYKNDFLCELLDGLAARLGPHWAKRDDNIWHRVDVPALPPPPEGTGEA